jgi:hypothetical protein
MKGGKKVVVGSGIGVLNIWQWGDWGDICDRYPVQPVSIDAMLFIDENTICIGTEDGFLK